MSAITAVFLGGQNNKKNLPWWLHIYLIWMPVLCYLTLQINNSTSLTSFLHVVLWCWMVIFEEQDVIKETVACLVFKELENSACLKLLWQFFCLLKVYRVLVVWVLFPDLNETHTWPSRYLLYLSRKFCKKF